MNEDLWNINPSTLNADEAARDLVRRLLGVIETLVAEVAALRVEKQRLHDEIARLKGLNGHPRIKANKDTDQTTGPGPKKPRRDRSKSKEPRSERIKIDREEVLLLDRATLPADFESKGYREVVVQEIRFETDNVRYRLERGYSAQSGQFYEVKLPEGVAQDGYGPGLHALILTFYFALRVPEQKIVDLLVSRGIVISAGEVSAIVTRKHLETFREERREVVKAGLQSTSYQHIDDTNVRVRGVNHYVTVLGNRFFTSYFIRRRKNAETVERLLALERLDQASAAPAALAPAEGTQVAAAQEPAEVAAEEVTLRTAVQILLSDDAGQFRHQTALHALCWWHEWRHYKKLTPRFAHHRERLTDFGTAFWKYYEQLDDYREAPTPEKKEKLRGQFDELFSPSTGYGALDDRVVITRSKKQELLVVLDHPEVPLENNQAERDVREVVVKRKISTGPRTADGAEAWEVFLSIFGTCRKNAVDFFAYVRDRISGANQMPALAQVIAQRAPP